MMNERKEVVSLRTPVDIPAYTKERLTLIQAHTLA